jgi:hypothetical protein
MTGRTPASTVMTAAVSDVVNIPEVAAKLRSIRQKIQHRQTSIRRRGAKALLLSLIC